MIKKLFLASVIISQLAISCSSDNNDESKPEETTEKTFAEEIAEIVKQPYANLDPAQQKIKLEAEANEILLQLDKTKSSSAIEAIENLNRLLDINSVDIFNGINDNQVEDILNVSGVYGIYTWNNANQVWVKTDSTTELRFEFPAKESQTANNAALSSKSVSSDIKVKLIDTNGTWSYDEEVKNYIETPSVNDFFFLPTSSNAILTIDKSEAATFSQTAKYANGKEVPNEFNYKVTLNDGYTWEMNGTKVAANNSKAALTYNGKNLIEFNLGSTANIDNLLEDDDLGQYRGKANGLIRLMDNFVIVADMDLATDAADDAALEKSVVYPTLPDSQDPKADFETYYNAENTYNKKYSEGLVASFNKNMKLVLVSKKDGTKIADLVQYSEKGETYTFTLPVWQSFENSTQGYWSSYSENGKTFTQQYYDEVIYLRFSDKTEVKMSVYFSEGFEKFETKFEDFITSFEK